MAPLLKRFLPLLAFGFMTLTAQASLYAGKNHEQERYAAMKEKMIETQMVRRGITDARVLDAIGKVDRHMFVPENLAHSAYHDSPLPIGYQQTISQPYMVAYMSELLQIEPDDKVLEIGTGSGYQAAVLAELAADVYSIEIVEPLFIRAGELLKQLGYENIRLKHGNGWMGWPEFAPFDKIIVTAAPDEIPQALVDQLREGGRMVIPVGRQHETQHLLVGVKKSGTLEKIETIAVRFVPLVKKEEANG